MPRATDPNVSYIPLYVMLAMAVICCLAIAGPRIIQPAIEDWAGKMELRSFESELRDVQHPPETEHISLRAVMGDFGGGEEGCDFALGEIRRYEGSKELILSAYMDQLVRGYPVQVVLLDDGHIPDQVGEPLPEPLNNLAGWELPSDVERQAFYLVYLVVLDYEGGNCR